MRTPDGPNQPGWLLFVVTSFALTGCSSLFSTPVEPTHTTLESCLGHDPSAEADQAPLRRLSLSELNAAADLLRVKFDLSQPFPEAPLIAIDTKYQFTNSASSLTLSKLDAEATQGWAESISNLATQDLEAALGCTPTAVVNECISDFVDELGFTAFRRPLDDSERQVFLDAYVAVNEFDTVRNAVRALWEIAVQSPSFLYISMDPTTTEPTQFDARTVANRISMFLYGEPADSTLLTLASDGVLSSDEGLRATVVSMLEDPRAVARVQQFHREWLHSTSPEGFVRDSTLFPGFNTAVAADIEEEFNRYIEEVVFESEGNFHALFTSGRVHANARLEGTLGLDGASAGDTDWVARDDARWGGILRRPLFLASTSGVEDSLIISRGATVLRKVMCMNFVVPDDVTRDLDVSELTDLPPVEKLQQVAGRAALPGCTSCHAIIDPMGEAFEEFGALGAHRAEYPEGYPVTQGGTLPTGEAFADLDDLMESLAGSQTVQECYAGKMLEFAVGRSATPTEVCEVRRLAAAGQVSIKEMLISLATSGLMLQRVEGEGQ